MRRIAVLLSMLILAAGVIALVAPVARSVSPRVEVGAPLPRIDVSRLKPGDYRFEDVRYPADEGWKHLVLRDYDGQVRVFSLPTDDGRFRLPDRTWSRAAAWCHKFGPETAGGKIVKGGTIRCHDRGMAEFGAGELRWNYDGRNLGEHTSDMIEPAHTLEGDYLLIGKWPDKAWSFSP